MEYDTLGRRCNIPLPQRPLYRLKASQRRRCRPAAPDLRSAASLISPRITLLAFVTADWLFGAGRCCSGHSGVAKRFSSSPNFQKLAYQHSAAFGGLLKSIRLAVLDWGPRCFPHRLESERAPTLLAPTAHTFRTSLRFSLCSFHYTYCSLFLATTFRHHLLTRLSRAASSSSASMSSSASARAPAALPRGLPGDIRQFLEHYPAQRGDKGKSANLLFYQDQAPGRPSRHSVEGLQDELRGNYRELERSVLLSRSFRASEELI